MEPPRRVTLMKRTPSIVQARQARWQEIGEERIIGPEEWTAALPGQYSDYPETITHGRRLDDDMTLGERRAVLQAAGEEEREARQRDEFLTERMW